MRTTVHRVLGKTFEHTLTRNVCLSDSTVKFTAMPKPFERGGLDLAALHGAVQRPECLAVAAGTAGPYSSRSCSRSERPR